jgi:hypothetical protein
MPPTLFEPEELLQAYHQSFRRGPLVIKQGACPLALCAAQKLPWISSRRHREARGICGGAQVHAPQSGRFRLAIDASVEAWMHRNTPTADRAISGPT